MLTRRSLLAGTAAASVVRPAIGLPAVGGTDFRAPTTVSFGAIFRYNSQYSAKYVGGDGYFPTWADDGLLYGVINDSKGVLYATPDANIEICSINGFTPPTSVIVASVNKMTQFGALGAMSSINQNWKAPAMLCVAGTLYCNTIHAAYTNGAGVNPWLPAAQSQIIKSVSPSHGATWTPLPPGVAQAYASPMFPNMAIGGYIQYGQNYTGGIAGSGPHGSDTYVYVFFINNATNKVGSSVTLGRVTIANLPNLVGSDWSFYQGGDGMVSGNWGAYSSSVPVFGQAITPGQAPRLWWVNGQYLPAFGCYVVCPSFWPTSSFSSTTLQIWKAFKPWGPWTQVGADYNTAPAAIYGVSIAPSSVATDGGKNTVLMAGGDYTGLGTPATSQYCLQLLPMTLS